MERIENDRIAKRVYVGEYACSCSLGRLSKQWINTVKNCLKERGLDVRLGRKMVHDRNEWWGVCEGGVCGA